MTVWLHMAPFSSSHRSQLGQFELGSPHVHWVLRDPPESWHPPFSSPISGPWWLAHWAYQGDVVHWEWAGQQHLGGEHPGADEALAGLHKVGTWEGMWLWGILQAVQQPEMTLMTATTGTAPATSGKLITPDRNICIKNCSSADTGNSNSLIFYSCFYTLGIPLPLSEMY